VRCSTPLMKLRTARSAPLSDDELDALKNLCVLAESGQREMRKAKQHAPQQARHNKRTQAMVALRHCSNRHQIDEHLRAQSPLRSVKEFTAFISAYGRVRDSRSSLRLFADLDRVSMTPDVICLGAVMAACVRGGQWLKALEIFDGMDERCVSPNVFVYSSAIAACDKGGQPTRALALLDEMPSRGLMPTVVCYNCAISALANAADWQRAVGLLDTMRRRGLTPDRISFNAAISACDKGGRWDKALVLLYRMEMSGIKADAVSFSAAIAACGNAGRWERSLSLLGAMERQGVHPSVYAYNACIAACGQAGQTSVAVSLFERLESGALPVQPDCVSFNAVLDAVAPQERARARRLWKLGVERGLYAGCERWDGPTPSLDLHNLSEGAAEAAVRWWLQEEVPNRLAAAEKDDERGGAARPTRLELVTGWGKHRESHQTGDLLGRVEAVLADMGMATLPSRNPGVLACVVPR